MACHKKIKSHVARSAQQLIHPMPTPKKKSTCFAVLYCCERCGCYHFSAFNVMRSDPCQQPTKTQRQQQILFQTLFESCGCCIQKNNSIFMVYLNYFIAPFTIRILIQANIKCERIKYITEYRIQIECWQTEKKHSEDFQSFLSNAAIFSVLRF